MTLITEPLSYSVIADYRNMGVGNFLEIFFNHLVNTGADVVKVSLLN